MLPNICSAVHVTIIPRYVYKREKTLFAEVDVPLDPHKVEKLFAEGSTATKNLRGGGALNTYGFGVKK